MRKSFDREPDQYYYARLMSDEFVIDSISFAKKSESLQGKIPVSSLKRVGDDLASSQGEIEFRLQGGMDGRQRPSLTLSIWGQVTLTCQRCLAEMAHKLELKSRLVLVASETQLLDLGDEDDEVALVLASGKMNIAELLEDEIILALPLAPKHDFECVDLRKL
jgi:uncharacterized protein